MSITSPFCRRGLRNCESSKWSERSLQFSYR